MAKSSSDSSDGSWEFVNEKNEYGLTKLPREDMCFPVAIVGLGCRMADVDTLTDYRDLLIDAATNYDRIPEDRWILDEWHDSTPNKLGYNNSPVAGLLPRLTYFDNLFFNTSPREAFYMDPHQFHVMEVTQRCVEDAGLTPETIPHNTAAFISMRMGEITCSVCENRNIPSSHILTGASHCTCANRVSFFYDIRGGSMGVEGACTAALASIHCGLWALWNKESDAVIAGGTSFSWCPQFFLPWSHHGYLSAQGQGRPFDASADGRIRSEGAGIVFMKPLADAIRDGDHVHCVIRGSALSYHGNNASITLHTPESFKHSMSSVYSQFGIPPEKIKYVEAHATGNADEDAMEAEAIGEMIGQKSRKPVKIGSSKANLGHTESAAGVLSLIKACLMLDNREYYPQPNFEKFHPDINAEKLNVQVPTKYEKYTEDENFLIGVNSTSFAGQQCHMVLEEYKPPPKIVAQEDLAGWKFGHQGKGRMLPIPLSGKSANALKDIARQWIEYKNEEDAQTVTGWLATRRDHYLNRIMVLANSTADLKTKLEAFLAGEPCDAIVEGKARPNFEKPKVCFVFPGQGQQWWNMGRQLYANEAVYRNIINECDKIWKKCSGYSFLEKDKIFTTTGYEDADPTGVDSTLTALIAIVANQVALYEQMIHWGVKPDMVVGHSLGECSSIYAAGGMTLEECITNIYIRATSQNKVSGTGTMAAARFTPEEAQEFCSKREDIWVACMNSTGNVTLGGGIPTVKKLCAEFPTKLKEIRVNSAFHTPHMASVKDEFVTRLTKIYKHRMARDDITFYSTVYGDVYQGPFDPAYWWENLGHRVNFVDACKSIFRDYGSDVIFLEIGSSATLLGNVRQTAGFVGSKPVGYVNCGMRNKDDRETALKAVGSLHTMGFPVNWKNLTRDAGKYIQLPAYPYQSNYYKLEAELFRRKRVWEYKQTYASEQGEINIAVMTYLADYKLHGKCVMPAASYIEYMAEMQGEDVTHLRDIEVNLATEVPQVMRNGAYALMWIYPNVDGSRVALHKQNEKEEHSSAIFAKVSIDELMLDVEAIDDSCHRTISAEEAYEKFSRGGLEYGPEFRILKEVKVADGEALGYITSHKSRHEVIQAVTLDGGFQVALAAFSKGDIYTVAEVESLKTLTDAMPVRENLVVYTRLFDWQLDSFVCDISIADENGNVLIFAQGVKFVNAAQPTVSVNTCLYTTNWETAQADGKISTKPWLIVYQEDKAEVANLLQGHLPGSSIVTQAKFHNTEPVDETNVLYLWSNRDDKNNEESDHDLKAVADIVNTASSFAGKPRINLCVVTPVDSTMEASLVQGYVRSISNSSSPGSIRGITVEMSSSDSMVSDILLALKTGGTNTEVAVQEGKLLRPIISRLPEGTSTVETTEWVLGKDTAEPQLRSMVPSKLDVNEVRIRVRAISRAHQGLVQCAGVVEDVGAGVTSVSLGEAVLGLMCSSVASIATCKEEYVVPKPERLTWAEASAFGFTSAVAYHALKDMIKVKAGDSIYVTDAEEPLGQAIVRVAKALGASVICSGDPATLIKMFGVVTIVNPTTLSFEKEMLQHTGGRGLDIAINTRGESVSQSLINCTRVAGKVAVVGYRTTKVLTDPRVTTCIISALDFINRRAKRLRECVGKAVSLLETGDLASTTLPQLSIGSKNITEDMISIEIPEGSTVKGVRPTLQIREDSTCVVTGGLGGIGLEVATWLVNHGAKHIALVSQHRSSIQQMLALEKLKEDTGAEVYEVKADVRTSSQVKMIFENLEQLSAPPVAGIFHTAASMQDIAKQSDEAIARLISSQAKSAQYLHQEAKERDLKLDHFVTFSSVASLLGVPKMAGWAASCNALDDLARQRRGQGLPSLSFQMGLVSGVGYTERNLETARLIEAVGTRALSIQQYLDVLERLLLRNELPATAAVVDQDWEVTAQACPGSREKFDSFVMDPIRAREHRRTVIRRHLVTFLGDELYWPYNTLEEDVPLKEYGMDLILTRALSAWLKAQYSLDLSFKEIAEETTIKDVVDRILATEA